jgi:hypothetical protein
MNENIIDPHNLDDYYKIVEKLDLLYRADKKQYYSNFPEKTQKLIADQIKLKENLTDIVDYISININNEPNIVIIGSREGHFSIAFYEKLHEYISQKMPMYFITKNENTVGSFIPNNNRQIKYVEMIETSTNHQMKDLENPIFSLLNKERSSDDDKNIDVLVCFDFFHIFKTSDFQKIISNYLSHMNNNSFFILGWKSLDHVWRGKGALIKIDFENGNEEEGKVIAETWDSRGFRPVKFVKNHKSLKQLINEEKLILLEEKCKYFPLTNKEFQYSSESQKYLPSYLLSLFQYKK